MRILAIETSGREAALAAVEGMGSETRLLREVDLAGNRRTAQALAPALDELLREIGWPAASLELIAVAVGPGSFTGLRIGVTTAKTLAYAVGAQVIGVNTLAVIAQQAPPTANPLSVVLDAQRQDLIAARFEIAPNGGRRLVSEPAILSQSDWLAALPRGDCVTGPGLARCRSRLPAEVHVVDQTHWRPLASSVGAVGWRDYATGRRDDLWKLVPLYYRPSAAEERQEHKKRSS